MEHFVPYLILGINTIIFQIARFLVNKISPATTRCLLTELVATLELCVDCAELGTYQKSSRTFSSLLQFFISKFFALKIFSILEFFQSWKCFHFWIFAHAHSGVAWELHGNLGYGLALFICCMWWCFHWDDAEACPNGPLEDCFLLGTSITSWPVLSKLVGQTVGAILTWRWASTHWLIRWSTLFRYEKLIIIN